MLKLFKISFICFFYCTCNGQTPLLLINQDSISGIHNSSNNTSSNEKITPYANFVSKYFKDLTPNNISIIFKRKHSPLSTMPSIWNVVRKKKNWRFKIYISIQSKGRLNKILFDSLGLNAQIGVLGHEFSHVQDFVRHNRWYMFKVVFWHLSSAKTDNFEYQTDLICIQQGLGFQLLSWSKEVRDKLDITLWKGASNSSTLSRERYMNPSTICNYIKTLPNYKQIVLDDQCE